MSGYAPDTLELSDTWRAQGACASPWIDPEAMFPSSAPGELAHAKQICAACPVRTDCGRWAIEKRIEFGVWGGMSESERRTILRRRAERLRILSGEAPRPVVPRKLADCGTPAAYDRHTRKGEVPDQACRDAHAKYRAERKAAKIEAAKCGTRDGYLKHLRDGVGPCRACTKANTDANRRRNNTRRPRAAAKATA